MANFKKAMVMSAGLGTRMRPVTNHMPKPLVPFLGKPLIDWTMELLSEAGVEDFIVNTHYLADMIHKHFEHDTRVTISHEETILETGGGMKHARALLGEEALFVANADVILAGEALSSIQALRAAWDEDKMDCLLLLVPKENAFGHPGAGDYFLGEDGQLRRRLEEPEAPYIFSSFRIMRPSLLNDTPDGAFSLRDCFDKAQKNGRLFGIVHQDQWLDISSVSSLNEAEAEFGPRYRFGRLL
ncbi:MAG: nucleotidyltransferase family protein [Alphaproteobacteria bacterium]|nr:nucleotidyltransferase family protein [Alphaproteobacteria bacterium]